MAQAAIDVKSLAAEILVRLQEFANPERKRVAASYTPTAMDVLGVAVPDLRPVVRDVSRRLKGAEPGDVLALVDELLAKGVFETRQAAYEILSRHRPAMGALGTKTVERLGKGMDNWASVDTFAGLIAGSAWREVRVTDAAVVRWAGSKDRWWRRAAVVSTVPLNQKSKGGAGDTPRTLRICDLLASDHDDMVAKGLSWALRALLARDRQAVVDFLDRHDEVLASRVKREVRNKLRTGLKTPRMGA